MIDHDRQFSMHRYCDMPANLNERNCARGRWAPHTKQLIVPPGLVENGEPVGLDLYRSPWS